MRVQRTGAEAADRVVAGYAGMLHATVGMHRRATPVNASSKLVIRCGAVASMPVQKPNSPGCRVPVVGVRVRPGGSGATSPARQSSSCWSFPDRAELDGEVFEPWTMRYDRTSDRRHARVASRGPT
jgi:hypothetical protein